MPKTETFEDRAARVAAEMAQVQQEARQRAQEEARRQAEDQHRRDQEDMSSWPQRRAALDEAVEAARQHLSETVEADPITQALARHLAAQTTRRIAWSEHIAALARTGVDTTGARLPDNDLLDPRELVIRTAERLAVTYRTETP